MTRRHDLPAGSFWDWDDAIRYAMAATHVHRCRFTIKGGALGTWVVRAR